MKNIFDDFIDITVYAGSFEIFTPNTELFDRIYKFLRDGGYAEEIKILEDEYIDTIEAKPKNMHNILCDLLWEFNDYHFRLF